MCPAALNMFWTAIRSPMSGGMPSIPRGKCTRACGTAGQGRLNFPAAEIEDAQGRKTLVKPGDAFIIPQGSRTVWRIEEYVKKYYLCVLDLED